jgi:hypothetical protein
MSGGLVLQVLAMPPAKDQMFRAATMLELRKEKPELHL